jgi:hypothetical protein
MAAIWPRYPQISRAHQGRKKRPGFTLKEAVAYLRGVERRAD